MTFGFLLALALQGAGGVAVENVPQIGIATRHARCIVRQVGVAPAEETSRAAKVQDAIKGCRAFVESDYAQGRILLGDRPVNKRWWGRMEEILDSVEVDVSAAIVQPKQYKIIWELPDGGRVDAYNAPEPLKMVKLLTVPL
ncbi:hypothetical protein MZO42_10400 [Sphingomonas psychrotolerans]|uniref:Uncharacterized protein n=1 Tax=Sphingomonas psychrotolerans TaxID=1327635 RepID=A0ABU3N3K5_9SPHN|nr:hypothetical protein [Sphingomonas psychrotolerans]MDT8759109.1 hypothetical protein [Sphingomonas psychrotolerans]